MNIIRSTSATTKDVNPSSIACLPSDGPMTMSLMICTFASIRPDLRTFARSRASSMEKSPVIEDDPPEISSLTLGAEYTWLSSTMAT